MNEWTAPARNLSRPDAAADDRATTRVCLLVLGMHRSGTSALARLLSLAGAKLPTQLMGAGPGNDTGHWESSALVAYHDKLLSQFGSAWDDWRKLDASKLAPGQTDAVKREIARIVETEFGDARLFVVKDPRICRFAPLFIEALEESGIGVAPVLIFRNPLEVIHSLEQRKEFWSDERSTVDAALMWLRHILDADDASRNRPRAILTYDSLLQDWRQALAAIAERTGISFPYSADEIAPLASEFLTPRQRHQTRSVEEVLLDPMLRGWIGDAYMAMHILAGKPSSAQALADLDEIRTSFDRSLPVLTALTAVEKAARARETQKAEAQRAAQAEELAALQQALADHAAQRSSLERSVADLGVRAQQLLQQSQGYEAEKARLAKLASEREQTIAALTAASAEKDRQIESLQTETEAKLQAMSEMSARIAGIDPQLAKRNAEAAELKTAFAEAAARLHDLEAALFKRNQEAAELESALATAAANQRELESQLIRRDDEAEALAKALSAGATRTRELEAQLAKRELVASELTAAFTDASQRLLDIEAQLAARTSEAAELAAALRQRDETILDLTATVDQSLSKSERDRLSLSDELGSRLTAFEDRVTELSRLAEERRERIAALEYERAALVEESRRTREELIAHFRGSTSWRVSAPVRAAAKLLRRRLPRGRRPPPTIPFANGDLPLLADTDAAADVGTRLVFFTICSRNFMAFARTLHASLMRFHPDAKFYVALCDEPAPPFDPAKEPFPFVYLDDLDLPEWREMCVRYNITEFNTAIKPFVFRYLFDKKGAKNVVYLDPDIYIVSRMDEIEEAFAAGHHAVLTPHMLEPAPKAEMNEKRLLQYGIYNLGFVALRNTPEVRNIVDWWGRRLKTECVIKRDEGLFVDQKWADHFPAFLPGTLVLRHPGYNVAYWNLSSRKVAWTGSGWEVNGQPLRFAHFSGNNLDDPNVLSRHSSEHRPETVGHLKYLLDEYRSRIFASGHGEYRKIPYAFSWNGAAGVNEHTPRAGSPPSKARATSSSASPPAAVTSKSPAPSIPAGATVKTIENLEQDRRGRRRGALARVKERLLPAAAPDAGRDARPWERKVLFVDWSTPRPDQDSGSRTSYYFVEILRLLGYRVTFLPCDMKHAGRYTTALETLGVRCIHGPDRRSIFDHLDAEGGTYDVLVLNRGPVVAHLLDEIRRLCPSARIIFNTVDLHYIRELREADATGSAEKRAAALATKKSELRVIAASDETIVLSSFEKEELARETPKAKVRVLPLVFSDIDPDPPGFETRSGILFIGSFPHRPNVDAVLYFAAEVFPLLRRQRPDLVWHVVGSAPPPEVLALGKQPGIVVHGMVEDLTPLFRSVRLSVAPLKYGAGIKGKIATSLSYGVPVVASRVAVEGMNVVPGRHVAVADTPADLAREILALHDDAPRWSRMSEDGQLLCVTEYSVPANTLRVGEMMCDLDPAHRSLDVFRFKSKREHDLFRTAFAPRYEGREAFERAALPPTEAPFKVRGHCAVCGKPSSFLTSYMYACAHAKDGRLLPNWREHLACDACGFTMRLRGAMHVYFGRYDTGPSSTIYLTEQVTPLFSWLKARRPNTVGSEFLGNQVPLGRELNGLRNEDLTRLTFPDQSFDAVLSFEVLEHVVDDLAAFRECYRCLRPGGLLFFTAPFAHDKARKVVRAERLPNGEIKHHLKPELHGNPVDKEGGALCYRYFGWDVIDDLRGVGFSDVEVLTYWSPDYAYLGPQGVIVTARK